MTHWSVAITSSIITDSIDAQQTQALTSDEQNSMTRTNTELEEASGDQHKKQTPVNISV